eukprot:TRINITY_DN59062_c0_g1_i1.p1 TRINITY_DN59062_c0_g1~~TRINITY_DN59062_c0_g1_i1.p1  ORF type:complete len:597 (+),score=149.05 TRINITY_DN59062_c0_g1_i1:97-1887(+)
MTTGVYRSSELLTPYCTPGNPPFKKGELVYLGDGRTATILRAYAFENMYAVRTQGSTGELRKEDGTFWYFKKDELQRVVPLAKPEPVQEPAAKVARTDQGVANGQTVAVQEKGPKRYEGRVKWFSRDKGFGKIEPLLPRGQQPDEDALVFVHKKQMDGGADGPHASAMGENILVTYELTTLDRKPCATNVQVRGIAPTALTRIIAGKRDENQDALTTQLLRSGLKVGIHQVTGKWKTASEDRFLRRSGVDVGTLGDNCQKAVCSIFGVFDGHSGASCSDFVAVALEKAIFDCLRSRGVRDAGGREVTSDVTVKSALTAAFRTTEHNFFQYANKLDSGAAGAWSTAGSTACTACLYGPDEEGKVKLVVANAGDSRAVLGKRDCRAVRLSEDHTPDVPSERKRIEQTGSAVVQVQGIWRIVLPSRRGTGFAGLSVSRGFGDLEYKQPATVVSAVPDVTVHSVDLREDCFVILASDGVWGPVEDADAVRIVASCLRESNGDVRHASRILAEQAHALEPSDDKTVIIVWFGGMPEPLAPSNRSSIEVPAQAALSRMKPRHVVAANTSDDMFAGTGNGSSSASAMEDLDDLFAAYSKEMGR